MTVKSTGVFYHSVPLLGNPGLSAGIPEIPELGEESGAEPVADTALTSRMETGSRRHVPRSPASRTSSSQKLVGDVDRSQVVEFSRGAECRQ